MSIEQQLSLHVNNMISINNQSENHTKCLVDHKAANRPTEHKQVTGNHDVPIKPTTHPSTTHGSAPHSSQQLRRGPGQNQTHATTEHQSERNPKADEERERKGGGNLTHMQELEVVLEVLERRPDGVQAPGLGHRSRRGGQGRTAAVFLPESSSSPTSLDEDTPIPAAGAGAGGGARRRRGGEDVGGGDGEDGVAEAVVEVPDPLQNRLRVRRVPSHHLAVALGFVVRVRADWVGRSGEVGGRGEGGGKGGKLLEGRGGSVGGESELVEYVRRAARPMRRLLLLCERGSRENIALAVVVWLFDSSFCDYY